MQLASQVALWCSVAGAVVLGSVAAVGQPRSSIAVEPAPAFELAAPPEPPPAMRTQWAPSPSAPPMQFGFVFVAGGDSYVKLALDDDALARVKHHAPVFAHDDYTYVAIAKVDAGKLPGNLPLHLGQQVVVDGSCTASVTGFAVVARLTGSIGYAGGTADDATNDGWSATSAFDKGEKQLAAQLSRCTGTWARDAGLAGAVVGAEAALDGDTIATVKTDLFASPLAKAADAAWDDPSWGEDATVKPWREAITVDVKAYTHEQTRDRWIVVKAMIGGSCGERTVDLAAIYRESSTGALVRVWSAEGATVASLVDVDNDGTFEAVVSRGFGDSRDTIERLDGTVVDTIALPFYGCPC